MLSLQADLKNYPFIQHKNCLQTAILGLEFEVFRPHLYGASLELDLRCTSGLSARVTNPDNPHKILEHHHQEVARLTSAGSLLRSGVLRLYSGSGYQLANCAFFQAVFLSDQHSGCSLSSTYFFLTDY